METCRRKETRELGGIICLCGRLLSPTRLLSEDGNEYVVCKETFYLIGKTYVFQLNIRCYPWRIINAIRLPNFDD